MKRILLIASIAWGLIGSEAAEHWPQFRGPNAGGVNNSAPLPTKWDAESGKNISWRTPIPGLAHASPIAMDGRLYVVTADSPGKAELRLGLYGDIRSADDQETHQWRLISIDAKSGKMLWNKLGHEGIPRVKRHTKATHANSTPATDGQKIVAIFGSEGLFCFNMDGELAWKKDLGPMDSGFFMAPLAQWGFASSPVIHDGKVIVQCDVQTNSFIAMFDLNDGKEIWRTPRTDVPTWSTPTIARHKGKTQILVNGWRHTGGYDFKTGHEIWRLNGGGDIPTPTPIVSGDLAYFTSAHGRFRPVRAIRLEARGDITPENMSLTNAAIAWVHPREGAYMQTPIIVGGLLFSCTDNGVLTCFDAATGEIYYSERITTGNEGFTSSPVSDGKHLYFSSETGKVVVVKAAKEFAVVERNDLGEPIMASPVIYEGSLYFRTREHLVRVMAE
ncbi:MAG: PQQ-binding-like beta-propeller repeat protein [Verrucomicrobiales bacterium]